MHGSPTPGGPRCHLLTGPPGAGKTSWLNAVLAQRRTPPAGRQAVLLAEQGRVPAAVLSRANPAAVVRELRLPCLCCQPAEPLIRAMKEVADASGADELFVEIPALMAESTCREIDQVLRWPRRLVVHSNRAWTAARESDQLSYFQQRLLTLADAIVDQPISASAVRARVQSPPT